MAAGLRVDGQVSLLEELQYLFRSSNSNTCSDLVIAIDYDVMAIHTCSDLVVGTVLLLLLLLLLRLLIPPPSAAAPDAARAQVTAIV